MRHPAGEMASYRRCWSSHATRTIIGMSNEKRVRPNASGESFRVPRIDSKDRLGSRLMVGNVT